MPNAVPVRQQLLTLFSISAIVLVGLLTFYATQFFDSNPFRSSPSKSHDIVDLLVFKTPSTAQKALFEYTDPLNVTRNLYYGPWQAEIPNEVMAGDDFELTFYCLYLDRLICPPYYMVFFHGPTRQTIPPDKFVSLNQTIGSPQRRYTVKATWKILDPGEYLVYAYPELVFCSHFYQMEFPWSSASVQGAPFRLLVKPKQSFEEGYGNCSIEEFHNGRYLSTNASVSSKKFAELYANTTRAFIWAPYNCKVPHRTVQQAITALPDASHFVFIGDSSSRGPFCAKVYMGVHGTVEGGTGVCDYYTKEEHANYWDGNKMYLRQWGNKYTHKLFNTNDSQRNISFSFLWLSFEVDDMIPTLLSLDRPTHIVFNYGLWVAWYERELLEAGYWKFLNLVKEQLPSVKHVIFKTTVSQVHPIQCYSDRIFEYPEAGIPESTSRDLRFAGSRSRHWVFNLARQWNKEGSPFRLSVIDGWMLTDNRPETSSEGRHWISEDSGELDHYRHGIGEPDDGILDRIWDDFIEERVIE